MTPCKNFPAVSLLPRPLVPIVERLALSRGEVGIAGGKRPRFQRRFLAADGRRGMDGAQPRWAD